MMIKKADTETTDDNKNILPFKLVPIAITYKTDFVHTQCK